MADSIFFTVHADTSPAERSLKGLLSKKDFVISLKADSAPLGMISRQLSQFDKSLEASNARVLAFGATTGAIYGVQKAFSSMISDVVEVEKALKGIQVILGASDSDLQKFGKGVFDVANKTGQSFKIAAEAATEFSRQGLGLVETLKATEAALILTRISGLDAVSAVSSLTAAVNTFSNAGLSHIDIVDKIVAVDLKFAVSAADLAEGLRRVGTTAVDSKVGLNELNAAITSVQQVTARGGAVIGNAFKSIFTRLQRTNVQQTLESIGVATKESNGEFRSAVNILQDLSNVYEKLADSQKSHVAETVAGVYQINTFKALLRTMAGGEMSLYNQALRESQSASEGAAKRNEELNQTFVSLIERTRNAATQFNSAFAQGGLESGAKRLVGYFDTIFTNLTKMTSKQGEFKNIFQFMGSSLSQGLGNMLSGPLPVMLSILAGKTFAKVFGAKEGLFGAIKNVAGIQTLKEKQLALEEKIRGVLAGADQKVVDQIQHTTSLIEKQTLLNAQIDRTLAKYESEKNLIRSLTASMFGSERASILLGKTPSSSRATGYIPNYAVGFKDAFTRESVSIAHRVGGVTPAAKPRETTIRMDRGIPTQVVANTQEKIVRNYAGGGSDAIFNPQMIKDIGGLHNLKKLGKVENVAGGFIPNYANTYGSGNIKFASTKRLPKDVVAYLETLSNDEVLQQLYSEVTNSKAPFRLNYKLPPIRIAETEPSLRAWAYPSSHIFSGKSAYAREDFINQNLRKWGGIPGNIGISMNKILNPFLRSDNVFRGSIAHEYGHLINSGVFGTQKIPDLMMSKSNDFLPLLRDAYLNGDENPGIRKLNNYLDQFNNHGTLDSNKFHQEGFAESIGIMFGSPRTYSSKPEIGEYIIKSLRDSELGNWVLKHANLSKINPFANGFIPNFAYLNKNYFRTRTVMRDYKAITESLKQHPLYGEFLNAKTATVRKDVIDKGFNISSSEIGDKYYRRKKRGLNELISGQKSFLHLQESGELFPEKPTIAELSSFLGISQDTLTSRRRTDPIVNRLLQNSPQGRKGRFTDQEVSDAIASFELKNGRKPTRKELGPYMGVSGAYFYNTKGYKSIKRELPEKRDYNSFFDFSDGFVPNYAIKSKTFGNKTLTVDALLRSGQRHLPRRVNIGDEVESLLETTYWPKESFSIGRIRVPTDFRKQGRGFELFSSLANMAKKRGLPITSSGLSPQYGSFAPNSMKLIEKLPLEEQFKKIYPQLVWREKLGMKTQGEVTYGKRNGEFADWLKFSNLSIKGLTEYYLNQVKPLGITPDFLAIKDLKSRFAKGFIPNYARGIFESSNYSVRNDPKAYARFRGFTKTETFQRIESLLKQGNPGLRDPLEKVLFSTSAKFKGHDYGFITPKSSLGADASMWMNRGLFLNDPSIPHEITKERIFGHEGGHLLFSGNKFRNIPGSDSSTRELIAIPEFYNSAKKLLFGENTGIKRLDDSLVRIRNLSKIGQQLDPELILKAKQKYPDLSEKQIEEFYKEKYLTSGISELGAEFVSMLNNSKIPISERNKIRKFAPKGFEQITGLAKGFIPNYAGKPNENLQVNKDLSFEAGLQKLVEEIQKELELREKPWTKDNYLESQDLSPFQRLGLEGFTKKEIKDFSGPNLHPKAGKVIEYIENLVEKQKEIYVPKISLMTGVSQDDVIKILVQGRDHNLFKPSTIEHLRKVRPKDALSSGFIPNYSLHRDPNATETILNAVHSGLNFKTVGGRMAPYGEKNLIDMVLDKNFIKLSRLIQSPFDISESIAPFSFKDVEIKDIGKKHGISQALKTEEGYKAYLQFNKRFFNNSLPRDVINTGIHELSHILDAAAIPISGKPLSSRLGFRLATKNPLNYLFNPFLRERRAYLNKRYKSKQIPEEVFAEITSYLLDKNIKRRDIDSLLRTNIGKQYRKLMKDTDLESHLFGYRGLTPSPRNSRKSLSSGFIPNFSTNPLQNAINREIGALTIGGVSPFVAAKSIRVNASEGLISKSNPFGLAVTNSLQQPGGISEAMSQHSKDPGRSMSRLAQGNIPNFADFGKLMEANIRHGIEAGILSKNDPHVKAYFSLKENLDLIGTGYTEFGGRMGTGAKSFPSFKKDILSGDSRKSDDSIKHLSELVLGATPSASKALKTLEESLKDISLELGKSVVPSFKDLKKVAETLKYADPHLKAIDADISKYDRRKYLSPAAVKGTLMKDSISKGMTRKDAALYYRSSAGISEIENEVNKRNSEFLGRRIALQSELEDVASARAKFSKKALPIMEKRASSFGGFGVSSLSKILGGIKIPKITREDGSKMLVLSKDELIEIGEGLQKNEREKVTTKRQNAAFMLSFLLPMAGAGAANLIGASLGGPETHKGRNAMEATNQIATGLSTGTMIASMGSGAIGTALGVTVAAFTTLDAILMAQRDNYEILQKEMEKTSAKFQETSQGIDQFSFATTQLEDFLKSGKGRPEEVKFIAQQKADAYGKINDLEMRAKLIAANGDKVKMAEISRDFKDKGGREVSSKEFSLNLEKTIRESSPFERPYLGLPTELTNEQKNNLTKGILDSMDQSKTTPEFFKQLELSRKSFENINGGEGKAAIYASQSLADLLSKSPVFQSLSQKDLSKLQKTTSSVGSLDGKKTVTLLDALAKELYAKLLDSKYLKEYQALAEKASLSTFNFIKSLENLVTVEQNNRELANIRQTNAAEISTDRASKFLSNSSDYVSAKGINEIQYTINKAENQNNYDSSFAELKSDLITSIEKSVISKATGENQNRVLGILSKAENPKTGFEDLRDILSEISNLGISSEEEVKLSQEFGYKLEKLYQSFTKAESLAKNTYDTQVLALQVAQDQKMILSRQSFLGSAFSKSPEELQTQNESEINSQDRFSLTSRMNLAEKDKLITQKFGLRSAERAAFIANETDENLRQGSIEKETIERRFRERIGMFDDSEAGARRRLGFNLVKKLNPEEEKQVKKQMEERSKFNKKISQPLIDRYSNVVTTQLQSNISSQKRNFGLTYNELISGRLADGTSIKNDFLREQNNIKRGFTGNNSDLALTSLNKIRQKIIDNALFDNRISSEQASRLGVNEKGIYNISEVENVASEAKKYNLKGGMNPSDIKALDTITRAINDINSLNIQSKQIPEIVKDAIANLQKEDKNAEYIKGQFEVQSEILEILRSKKEGGSLKYSIQAQEGAVKTSKENYLATQAQLQGELSGLNSDYVRFNSRNQSNQTEINEIKKEKERRISFIGGMDNVPKSALNSSQIEDFIQGKLSLEDLSSWVEKSMPKDVPSIPIGTGYIPGTNYHSNFKNYIQKAKEEKVGSVDLGMSSQSSFDEKIKALEDGIIFNENAIKSGNSRSENISNQISLNEQNFNEEEVGRQQELEALKQKEERRKARLEKERQDKILEDARREEARTSLFSKPSLPEVKLEDGNADRLDNGSKSEEEKRISLTGYQPMLDFNSTAARQMYDKRDRAHYRTLTAVKKVTEYGLDGFAKKNGFNTEKYDPSNYYNSQGNNYVKLKAAQNLEKINPFFALDPDKNSTAFIKNIQFNRENFAPRIALQESMENAVLSAKITQPFTKEGQLKKDGTKATKEDVEQSQKDYKSQVNELAKTLKAIKDSFDQSQGQTSVTATLNVENNGNPISGSPEFLKQIEELIKKVLTEQAKQKAQLQGKVPN